jgi:hypothetical protein
MPPIIPEEVPSTIVAGTTVSDDLASAHFCTVSDASMPMISLEPVICRARERLLIRRRAGEGQRVASTSCASAIPDRSARARPGSGHVSHYCRGGPRAWPEIIYSHGGSVATSMTRRHQYQTGLSCFRARLTCLSSKLCSGGLNTAMALSRLSVCIPEMLFKSKPAPCTQLSIGWSVKVGCVRNGNRPRASSARSTTASPQQAKDNWPVTLVAGRNC